MVTAGQRDTRIVIEHAEKERDAVNALKTVAWRPIARPWVRVRYGSASDQRTAAQEQESQTATLTSDYSTKLLAVTTTDRVRFAGRIWDIKGIAPSRQHGEIVFTVVSSKPAQ